MSANIERFSLVISSYMGEFQGEVIPSKDSDDFHDKRGGAVVHIDDYPKYAGAYEPDLRFSNSEANAKAAEELQRAAESNARLRESRSYAQRRVSPRSDLRRLTGRRP